MAAEKFQGELRSDFGKGSARQARRDGKVPGVIYGHGATPVHVLLPAHELTLAVRTPNALLEVSVDGEQHLVIVKDVQRDFIKQTVDHVDLLIVKRGEKVQVEIPVHVEGEEAPGAVVNVETGMVTVEAEATHLPEAVTVDITGREIGEHVHGSDLKLDAKVELITDAETIIVTISEPQAVELPEPGETEEAEGEAAEAEAPAEEASEEA